MIRLSLMNVKIILSMVILLFIITFLLYICYECELEREHELNKNNVIKIERAANLTVQVL